MSQRPFALSKWISISVVVAAAMLGGLQRPVRAADTIADSLDQARRLAVSGNLTGAIAQVEAQLPKLAGPNEQAAAREFLGDLWQSSREKQGVTNALLNYDQAITLNPNRGTAYEKKADLLFSRLASPENAMATLRAGVDRGITNAGIYYLMGGILKFYGDESTNSDKVLPIYLAALTAFQRTLELDPNHAPAVGQSGDILFNLQRYAESVNFYEKAISMAPNSHVALAAKSRLAHALSREGKYDRAEKLLLEIERAYGEIPLQNNPGIDANLALDKARIVSYQFENHRAAKDATAARRDARKLRAAIATCRRTFNSPVFQDWDDEARRYLEAGLVDN